MFVWPEEAPRIPDEEWAHAPVASLAQKYDAVGRHGWYTNLDPTVDGLAARLGEGSLLVDYSGGTGLLLDRLLERVGALRFHAVDVDASPKFLALAAQKLGADPRVAFRLLRYLKEERRLQALDEALPAKLVGRVDALVSANAVHLYQDLDATFASWARVVRPGGFVHVQSGNMRNVGAAPGAWIIDDTVEAVDAAARVIVRAESRFSRHRAALDDAALVGAHEWFQKKVFLPVRPVGDYVDALRTAGFVVDAVRAIPIGARVDEWHEFLVAYSDAVLGWVGGHEKISGAPPSEEDRADRLALMRLALEVVVTGKPSFDATWTYIDATRP